MKKPIETMHRSAQKAAAIVQDMLTLSRRGAIAKETIHLNTVVQDYVNSLECKKMLSYHPRVSIQADLADDLLTIRASAVHVSKIVMNLVSNAAEAMPEGGIIAVRTKNRHVDTEVSADETIAPGDYCELCVSDTGVGMSAEDLDKVFEPFFTKKKMGRSGTGLGMAVVWGSVKDHDGHILVESDLGKGTDIRILLPASRHRLVGLETKTEIETLRGNGEHILVIDDIQDQLDIATDMLRSLGYSAEGVSGGQAALDYLETTPCDLIILDMIMDPGMDGLETWSRIIERHPHQKAILSSGYSETDRVKAAQRLGAGHYLRKPYTLDKIGQAVQNALNKPGLT